MSPKQILGQWHDKVGPVLSNRYQKGRFWFNLTLKKGTTQEKKFLNPKHWKKGKWMDFLYRIRWTRKDSGLIQIWFNQKLTYEYHGRTLMSPKSRNPYFKFGIYRSHLFRFQGETRPTQILYFDEYRRGFSRKAVEVTNFKGD